MALNIRNLLVTLFNIALGVIAFFLGLRIILRLFSANPQTPFVNWVYGVSDALISPFAGMFPNFSLAQAGIFDLVALLSLVIYALLIYAVIALIDAATRWVGTDRTRYHEPGHAH